MSSTTSYRLSGIALILGSVLTIVYQVGQAFVNGNDLTQLASPLAVISSLIGFIGAIFVMLGLPGVYARQAQQAGILGLLGFLFIWYVTLFQGILIPFTSVTIVPALVANPVTRSLLAGPPPWAPFFLVSLVGQTLGTLLLAIATLRARVFPRWIGWLLIATLVVGVVSQVPFFPETLGNLAATVGSVAIAGFGYALLSPRLRESKEAVPANAEVQVRA